MRWLKELTRPARVSLKRRFVSRGLILIYHRVADDPVDPWGLCVSPDKFAQHMEVIQESGFHTAYVSELADAFRARRLARGTVAITFDDGYADNLDAARPILERHGIAASHFATAGYIGSDEPFWWDVLDLVFLRTKQLPDALSI